MSKQKNKMEAKKLEVGGAWTTGGAWSLGVRSSEPTACNPGLIPLLRKLEDNTQLRSTPEEDLRGIEAQLSALAGGLRGSKIVDPNPIPSSHHDCYSLIDPPVTDNDNPSSSLQRPHDQLLSPSIRKPRQGGIAKFSKSNSNPHMLNPEDFPALPGPTTVSNGMDTGSWSWSPSERKSQDLPAKVDPVKEPSRSHPIPTSSKGNWPSVKGVVKNQFGMAGLMACLNLQKIDPSFVTMPAGFDLWNLGMNVDPGTSLLETFGGPLAGEQLLPEEIDFHVPSEYRVTQVVLPENEKTLNIKDALTLNMSKFTDDTVFYIFYKYSQDVLQMLAAAELYKRGWRFQVVERIWLFRLATGPQAIYNGSRFEHGMFCFFDCKAWKYISKEYCVDYSLLEGRPFTIHTPATFGVDPLPDVL